MGGSSSTPTNTTVQTQSKDPWSGAVPALQQIMGSAQSLYGGDVGFQPYSGPTQAPLDPQVSQGLAAMSQIAQSNLGGTPDLLAAQGLATDVISNQGITPGIRGALTGLGNVATAASGQNNPYLQNVIADNNQKIANQLNSQFSGSGRYGSGMHTDVLGRALAQSADPILAQDYTQRQQLLSQLYGQEAGIYGQGLQQAGQFSQLVPTLDQAQYMPSQMLASVGQYYTDRAQQGLNDQINLWNAQQARPWEQLSRENAIVGGAGQIGGTTTSTIPIQQPSTLQRLFGGGLAGAGIGSAFGPVGSGIGAVGGGLLGLLGR